MHDLRLFRSILILTLLVALVSLASLFNQANLDGVLTISVRWQAALVVVGSLSFLVLLLLISTFTKLGDFVWRTWTGLHLGILRLGSLRLLLGAFLLLVPTGLILLVNERFLLGLPIRLLLTWTSIVVATEFIAATDSPKSWFKVALGCGIATGVIHRAGLLFLFVGPYPLTLGWSEASRYYYASLLFSERLYGSVTNPSVLHPTRYFMQGLAFLLPQAGLSFHRLWQVVLWITTTTTTGILLARRLGFKDSRNTLALIGFTIIFLFQGPVYYHLLIMVITILLTFDHRRLWRASFFVVMASIWAGLSRINWYPMPGILAASLYFFETERLNRSAGRYWRWPAAWVLLGSATAFLSQLAYVKLSGNPPELFSSSFSSSLLWYRLWPNATYDLGILPGILIASVPMIVVLWHTRSRWIPAMGWERYLPVLSMILVLWVGGIIVSLKIGGGSNLHNLDAYLVLLGLFVAYASHDRIIVESDAQIQAIQLKSIHVMLLLLIPALFNLREGEPLIHAEPERAAMSIEVIREEIDRLPLTEPEVLFISQRQLITFNTISNVRLIPEYETVFLMEMAMSGTKSYLDEFHRKLQDNLFDLIIVAPLGTGYQTRERAFSEENNAWVREVSEPVLCYYEALYTDYATSIQVLRPRIDPCK